MDAAPARVRVETLDETRQREQVASLIDRSGLAQGLGAGDQVFLKPNLTYPRFSAGITTRASFVGDVAAYFVERGCRVTVGEGPGGYNGFSMRRAFEAHGLTEVCHRVGASLVELSEWETGALEVTTRQGRTVAVPISKALVADFRAVVSLPVPKVHCMTGVSLGLKNLWGMIPDTFRIRFHPYLDEILTALATTLPLRGAVLDGLYGLDVNGPMVDGEVRPLRWIAASSSCPALDVAITGLLGFNPEAVPHLRYGMARGVVPRPGAVVCAAEGVARQSFRLRPNMWNRLAALTWRHSILTWLVYLSPLSGPIHWVMYLFRKKPPDMAVRGWRGWEERPPPPEADDD